MIGDEPTKKKGLMRRGSQILQEWDAKLLEEERQHKLTAEARAAVEASKGSTSKGLAKKKKFLARTTSQELPDSAASEHAPPVVLGDGAAAAALPKHLQAIVSPIAGMMAGALEITSLWPMEWAKVQTQLNQGNPGWTLLGDARRVGIGMYKGLPPMLIGVPLQGAVRFSTLDSVKAILVEPGTQPGPATNLVAGMLAGTLEATLVVTPVETVKTRLVDADKGLLRGVYDFVQAEGIGGIYRGLFATICKSASNQALRFFIFGEYKRYVWGSKPKDQMPPHIALGGGMLAGALGSVITMPFDVLKTKMQGLNAAKYSGTFNCLITVVRDEGFLALYNGLGARLGRAVPGQGIIFASYEVFHKGITNVLTPKTKEGW